MARFLMFPLKTSMDGLGASQQAMITVTGWFSNSLSKQQPVIFRSKPWLSLAEGIGRGYTKMLPLYSIYIPYINIV